MKRSRSVLARRPPGFGFDPRFLSDCRFGRIERVPRGRLRNLRESGLAVWREFHMRRLAHFRRPASKFRRGFRSRSRAGNARREAPPVFPAGAAIQRGLCSGASAHVNCSEPTTSNAVSREFP
jgi:hypothetical protein